MNKKTVVIASGVAVGILAISACNTGDYEYEVSGVVQAQQLDYDCPGEDIAMDAVAFVESKGGGKKSKKSSSGKKADKKADDGEAARVEADVKVADKKPLPSTPPGKASPSASPRPSFKGIENKGVKLKSKPEKPEKLKGKTVPKPTYKVKPEGCETEYEIFVLANDGYLYEQDVRRADFENCERAKIPAGMKAKLFPLCTKG